MHTETKGSVAVFFKGKLHLQESSFQARSATLKAQGIDDFHPSDSMVMSQISDCLTCPGREKEIVRLLGIRDRLEAEVGGSSNRSVLHKIDAKLALCNSCGKQEKPRVLIKSA
jgi:hypothetical protein